jgi:hypothetical protein
MPTGPVSFTSSGSGNFSGTPCALAGTGISAICSVTYVPSTAGMQTITASYGGDPTHSPSSGTTTVSTSGLGAGPGPTNCTPGPEADLTGCNFAGVNLSGADLAGANLTDANLSGATLIKVRLVGANLTDANLSNADLSAATLTESNLTGANLTGAVLFAVISGGIIGEPSSLPTGWSLVTGVLTGPNGP